MREQIKRGDKVIWQKDGKTYTGHVVDSFLQSGTHTLANSGITNMANRNALLIELSDGSKILKLENDVKRG